MWGHLLGYQYGNPDAFWSFLEGNQKTLDSTYVDGISITYGNSPRKHIWTYVGGSSQNRASDCDCPCNNGSTVKIPPFIGSDYYCESGTSRTDYNDILYDDSLWDGQQCKDLEGSCCTHSNMPWFIKSLGDITTENIELRSCFNRMGSEDTPLKIIELFVRWYNFQLLCCSKNVIKLAVACLIKLFQLCNCNRWYDYLFENLQRLVTSTLALPYK